MHTNKRLIRRHDDRLKWTDVFIILLPLLILVVLASIVYVSFRTKVGQHPFEHLDISATSPDQKFAVEENSFGDDDGAFVEWSLASTSDPKRECLTWADPPFYQARWKDSRTLELLMAEPLSGKTKPMKSWHGIRFIYIDESKKPGLPSH